MSHQTDLLVSSKAVIIDGFAQIFQSLGYPSHHQLAEELFTEVELHGFSSLGAMQILDSFTPSVRDTWNNILDNERSATLGAIILPYCRGRTADLLSGTGSVTRWLSEFGGIDVVAYERLSQYQRFQFPTIDISRLSSQHGQYETVLAIAVLHHEASPAQFMQNICSIGAKRAIIVENCLVPEWPQDAHDYMDSFFNLSLNQFGIDCPGEHQSEVVWIDFLSKFGEVSKSEYLPPIPGIPFPYHLFVVELY